MEFVVKVFDHFDLIEIHILHMGKILSLMWTDIGEFELGLFHQSLSCCQWMFAHVSGKMEYDLWCMCQAFIELFCFQKIIICINKIFF